MKTCEGCGKNNDEKAKFCGGCGSRFAEKEGSPAPPTASSPTDDDFAALFRLSETASTDESEVFPTPPANTADAIARSPDELGAEELEELFKEPSSASTPGLDAGDIDDIFADAPPLTGRNANSFASSDGDDQSLDSAFNKLLKQRSHEVSESSSVSAASSVDSHAEEPDRTTAIDETDDSITIAPAESPPPPEPTPENVDVSQDNEDEPQDEVPDEEPQAPRQPKNRRAGRSPNLHAALARSRLSPPPTFLDRFATTTVTVCLSIILGESLRSMGIADLSWFAAVVTCGVFLVSWIIKRLSRADYHPLGLLNVLLVTILVALAFDPTGTLPRNDLFRGLPAVRFQPLALLIVLLTSFVFVGKSVLLHRTFRWVILTVGVYGSIGLIRGMMAGNDLVAIIAERHITLVPGESTPDVLKELATAFEPTFVAVNLFLPVVGIVMVFETVKLAINKIAGRCVKSAAACCLLAFTIILSLNTYEAANIPNLRSIIQGVLQGSPPPTLLEQGDERSS